MGIPMFNESWIALSIIIIIVGLLLQQPALLAVASLLLTVAGVSWVWNRYALHGVEYERTFSERRVFQGESVELVTRVTNRKLLPLSWLRVDDQVPADLNLLDGEVLPSVQPELGYLSELYALRWYERVNRRYRLKPHRRGFYAFGPVQLRSGDFFGLFERRQALLRKDWLVVYPEVRPLYELGLPTKDPFGDSKAWQRIFEDPARTIGVREYQPEDSFRTSTGRPALVFKSFSLVSMNRRRLITWSFFSTWPRFPSRGGESCPRSWKKQSVSLHLSPTMVSRRNIRWGYWPTESCLALTSR
jgi:uncharacterized protein (DUF58 family)